MPMTRSSPRGARPGTKSPIALSLGAVARITLAPPSFWFRDTVDGRAVHAGVRAGLLCRSLFLPQPRTHLGRTDRNAGGRN